MADDHTREPKVLIIVKGGVVTEVFSDQTLEVLILDNDEYPDETFDSALEKLSGELTPQAITDAIKMGGCNEEPTPD